MYHEFMNSKNYQKLHTPFANAILNLEFKALTVVKTWWSKTSPEYFERLVDIYKEVVKYMMHFEAKKIRNANKKVSESHFLLNLFVYILEFFQLVLEQNFKLALSIMTICYQINHSKRIQKVPYETFHIPEVVEYFDIRDDYCRWNFDNSVS